MTRNTSTSVAAGIKSSDGPPKEPGTSTAELLYHFGPYAPAAAISRFDGLQLGDAFARVTRGASLWALVLSCFGLGTLLSLKATGEKFGGVMSVAGLFFYGSLLSLFTDERNGSSYVTGAILFKIPTWPYSADGGPFSHLILGHSMLHGLGAITAIMGLCLIQRERGAVPELAGASFWWRCRRLRCLSELGGRLVLPGRSGHSLVLGAPRSGAFMAADRADVRPVSRSLEHYGLQPFPGHGASDDQ